MNKEKVKEREEWVMALWVPLYLNTTIKVATEEELSTGHFHLSSGSDKR